MDFRTIKKMRLTVAAIIFTFFAVNTATGQSCGRSHLDPSHYAGVDSHSDLRQLIVRDLSKYRASDGPQSVLCFARHFSAMGDDQPFGTNSWFRYGKDSPIQPLYYFDVLVWRKQPGTDQTTSVGFWVKLVSIDSALAVVDDQGLVLETLTEEFVLAPRACSPSQFDPRLFTNVRSKREISHLIEQTIRAYIEADGQIDWLCFAEAFMEMDEHLREELWADLIIEGPNQGGVYRFTIQNVKLIDRLLPAPGGSNGTFTAIVRVEAPRQIAIVERGGHYRWLAWE